MRYTHDGEIKVPWGEHWETLDAVDRFIRAYSFCVPELPAEPVPIVLITDFRRSLAELKKTAGPDNRFRGNVELDEAALRKTETVLPGYVATDGYNRRVSVQIEIRANIRATTGNRRGMPTDGNWGSHHMTLRDIFEGAFYSVMLRGRERSQAWDMYQVLRWGFFPLYWKGIWPKGYCLAYCPAELPHAKVPAECVPTPEQLADGDRKRAKPTPMPPCPDYPATSPEGWKELVDRPDRATAFRQHFSPFIHTSDGNELLDLLGKQVSAFKVQGKKLIVQFGGDAYMACKPPWTGSLAAVPPTVGAVIRVHNGMSLFHSGGEADEWRTFNGKTFPHSDWRDWWEGDPDDSDNPFPKMPLIPITTTDGSGLWIIHPDKRLPNGEPAAVYLDARLGDPDPRPIGEIWLEIIASTLTLMDAMKRR